MSRCRVLLPVRGDHGGRHAGRVALVLDVALHADHRRGVGLHAHADAGHEDAVEPARQQAAVRRVARAARRRMMGLQRLLVVREQGEIGIERIAVDVVIAGRQHDAVGIRPPGDLIDVAEHVVADDPPPLARLEQGAGVVGLAAHGQPRTDQRLPRVEHVRLVDQQVVAVDGARVERPDGQARALDGNVVRVAAEDGLGAGGDGHVGVARGVDHAPGQHDPASFRRGHDRAPHATVLDQRPAAEHAEPDFAAGLADLAAIPLHLVLDVVLFVGKRHFLGEADEQAVIGARDRAQRARAAQRLLVLDHQRLGALPRGADGGARAGRPAAHDDHVVLAQHGQAAGLGRDRLARLVGRPQADEDLHARRRTSDGSATRDCPGKTHAARGDAVCRASSAAARPSRRATSVSPPGSSSLAATARGTSAQPLRTYSRSSRRGTEVVEGRRLALLPCGRAGAAHDRIGRHAEQRLGRPILPFDVGLIAGFLLGAGQGNEVPVGHRQLQAAAAPVRLSSTLRAR